MHYIKSETLRSALVYNYSNTVANSKYFDDQLLRPLCKFWTHAQNNIIIAWKCAQIS